MRDCFAAIGAFIRRHPKDAAIMVLLLMVVWQTRRLRVSKEQNGQLAPQSMPADVKQIVTVYRDRIVTKWREGPAKVEYRDRYIPPEGSVTLNIRKEDSQKGLDLKIKDWGFTCRLGGGTVYSDEILPEADVKWFYFRRYSLLTGITPRFGGIGFSRHIDDFTPFQNLELLADAGVSWHGDMRLGIGLRSNF